MPELIIPPESVLFYMPLVYLVAITFIVGVLALCYWLGYLMECDELD